MSTEEKIVAVYDRIKNLCKTKGVTQIDMCNACNMNIYSHKGRITRNIAPDVFDTLKIAQFLGTSVEYLVTGKDTNPLADENSRLKNKIQKAREILS